MRRGFHAEKINQKWFGDGTEIGTAEGKLHLASVLDIASRRIVGFALAEHHDAELAYGALAMAAAVRGGQVTGVIMHTDQGSEYTAGGFRAACTRLGITQSMGRPGSALDNAVIESFHSALEFELRALEHFATRAKAGARAAAWIDEYNRERRHSACQMMSPSPSSWLRPQPGPRDRGRPAARATTWRRRLRRRSASGAPRMVRGRPSGLKAAAYRCRDGPAGRP